MAITTTSGTMGPPRQTKHPLVSYQPIRFIYHLVKLATNLTKVPFWLIRALVPALRQHPNWTFKQSLTSSITRAVITHDSAIGITEPQSLKPGKEGDRWALIQPFDDALYVGPLVSQLVRPAQTGGTWYPTAPTASSTSSLKKVVMHIHGGAFVQNDGRDADCGYLCGRLVTAAGFDAVLAPQYRLAGHGGRDPFPAALQDALTCYLYLVRTLGIPAARVTVSGDSAGGNLAVALLRYLEVYGEELAGKGEGGVPLPGGVVLVSPWVQPREALEVDYRLAGRYATDFMAQEFLAWGARAYGLQSDRYGDCEEYVNSLGRPFGTSVPVFVTIGAAEVMCPQGVRWADEMRGVEGNRVVVNLQEDAPHDVMFIGDKIGWDEGVVEVMGKIGRFVDGELEE